MKAPVFDGSEIRQMSLSLPLVIGLHPKGRTGALLMAA